MLVCRKYRIQGRRDVQQIQSSDRGVHISENVGKFHGSDIFGTESTTIVRDSIFKSPENGIPRMQGPLITCESPTDLDICPSPTTTCIDEKGADSSYGVTCHLPCELGYYGIAPAQCTPCDSGKYASKVSAHESRHVNFARRASKLPAQSGDASCKNCSIGYHSTLGAPKCYKVCLRGEEQISRKSCTTCPAGRTSNNASVQECVDCDPGKVATTEGLPHCSRCPAGKRASASLLKCEICPPRMERPHDVPSCRKCESGFVSEKEGSAYCSPCKGGFYANANATGV